MSGGARFVAAVLLFAFRGERFLALRRAPANESAPGLWEGISGRVEPGEQPLDTARREAREESGLVVEVEARPVTAYLAKRNQDDMLVVVYRGRASSGEVVLSDEHDACAWMTLPEFATSCDAALLVKAARLAATGAPRRLGGGPAGRGRPRKRLRG
jgi:8-oxo-dGTP pyrophosphatase MutT (NUDIX family)